MTSGGRIQASLDRVKAAWAKINPGHPFEYHFFDEAFDLMYRADERLGTMVKYFAGMGILVACLGLFGLAAFTAAQRTKEIGVRKVLGGSTPGLAVLLGKEFLVWVAAANLLAWPLAFYAGRMWLKSFAYKTPLGPGTFLAAGGLALGIALLTGLARLSEAISSVMAPAEFFARLVEALLPIFDAEVLGFLMLDEPHGQLRAQPPFMGIPADFLDFYQAAVASGSEAERLIQAHETIHAPQAASDPRLHVLGIDHIAQAAGLKETILEPIAAGGRTLGFIQLANKRSGAFTPDDFRMLEIVAAQVGAMLENARLLQESRQRTRRSEAHEENVA